MKLILILLALWFGALGVLLLAQSLRVFVLDALREDDVSNRQSDRLGREVERVTVHAGSIGR